MDESNVPRKAAQHTHTHSHTLLSFTNLSDTYFILIIHTHTHTLQVLGMESGDSALGTASSPSAPDTLDELKHDFRLAVFSSPTTCYQCNTLIWYSFFLFV